MTEMTWQKFSHIFFSLSILNIYTLRTDTFVHIINNRGVYNKFKRIMATVTHNPTNSRD